MAPIDLTGLSDLHIHTSPDIRPRHADDVDTAREAADAGMRAILCKSHWTLTADRAAIAEKSVGGRLRVFGGLALNASVGWLNPRAVEVALQMGARQIWMPTLDLAGPGGHRLDAPVIVDRDGKVRAEVNEILDLVRQADAILGTGHLAVHETVQIVALALERGLRKILVTHPDASFIDMPVATQRELRGEGVYFERCYNGLAPEDGGSVTVAELASRIREVGVESTVLSSDYGQAEHPAPTAGLHRFLVELMGQGFSWDALQRMAGENPAHLLGI